MRRLLVANTLYTCSNLRYSQRPGKFNAGDSHVCQDREQQGCIYGVPGQTWRSPALSVTDVGHLPSFAQACGARDVGSEVLRYSGARRLYFSTARDNYMLQDPTLLIGGFDDVIARE